MRNFWPKYDSFVVVMPPKGKSTLTEWHLPKAALTHRAKCQDKGYQASSLLPQWDKPQESVAVLSSVQQHVMSSSDLHGSEPEASFTASGVPSLSASFKPYLDPASPWSKDATAENVHHGQKTNPVFTVYCHVPQNRFSNKVREFSFFLFLFLYMYMW